MLAAIAPAAHPSASQAATHPKVYPAFLGAKNTNAKPQPQLANLAKMTAPRHPAGERRAISGDSEGEDISVPEAVSKVWGTLRGKYEQALKQLSAHH